MAHEGHDDWTYASALSLAEQVRARRIGCLELLEHYIARIERYDAQLNAVVVRDFEVARERARRLDAQASRDALAAMPFAGVPMTVKESYDLAGHPTTWGLEQYREHRAREHALPVERFLAAGANVMGKTNVPVMLADWQTYNPVYGTTNNPWDTTRVPGGSSGGSAAALAAGLTALEIGSDIGGSIRGPAHYCGVYGHKPTWGICARLGHSLGGAVAEADISVIGPLARSARDLQAALDVMAGPDAIDGAGWKLALPAPRPASLRDYRVAVMADHPTAPVDASVRRAVGDVAEFLRREGATVSEDARPDIDPGEAHELFVLMLRAGTSSRLDDAQLAALERTAATLPADARGYTAWLARGATMRHRDWLRLNERRHRMRFAWARFFERWDALVCPIGATEAFAHNPHGERWERMIEVDGKPQPSTTQLFWAGWPGLFLLPATAVPAGRGPTGLPIGVQIIGAQHADRTTLDLARRLEQGYRGFAPPPAYA